MGKKHSKILVTGGAGFIGSHIIDRLARASGDVPHEYADISKAKKLLGYNPKFSIKEDLTGLVDWYTKNTRS